MTSPPRELSTWELDNYYASGQPAADVEQHVDSCLRCRRYLEALAAAAALPLPDGVASGGAIDEMRHRQGTRRWIASALGAVVLAAGTAAVLRIDGERTAYVGVKTTPAVQVLLQSGAEAQIWDGRSAVQPGDALALRVGCNGFDHVTVATLQSSESRFTRVFDGRCPPGEGALPFSLLVDDAPGPERLAMVLSSGSLDEASFVEAVRGGLRTQRAWAIELLFPKHLPAR